MAANDNASPKKRGSKLNRSETLTVRFDPVTRYAVELAAAKDRQTVSSFVEQAARSAAGKSHITLDDDGKGISALEFSERTWSHDPATRLYHLALEAPHLLPSDKQLLGEAMHLFVGELLLLMEIAKFRDQPVPLPKKGHITLISHVVKAAFPEIEACVSAEAVDRQRLIEVARTQLVTRGIIQID